MENNSQYNKHEELVSINDLDKAQHSVAMEKNLENYDLVSNDANVKLQNKNADNVIRSHKCNQCNYASSYKGHLRNNLKTHSGEKSNKCNQCDFTCSDPRSFWKHFKTHNGEKLNKCNQCDYASSQAGNFRKHLKTHSGEKSNKCNQCD